MKKFTQDYNYTFSNGEFANVTLVCDDKKTLKANKSILSAASDFFRDIFLDNSDPECVVILPEYECNMLEGIVSFIYTGLAQVTQDSLESFQNICKQFLINAFDTEVVEGIAKLEVKGKELMQVKQEKDITYKLDEGLTNIEIEVDAPVVKIEMGVDEKENSNAWLIEYVNMYLY